jgi:hypothetical protein
VEHHGRGPGGRGFPDDGEQLVAWLEDLPPWSGDQVRAPLERLAVRQISARFLSQEERIEIADLRHAGVSIWQVASRLGRAPSTVSRELRRNTTGSGGYRPFEADRQATARRAAITGGGSRPTAS